MLFSLPIMRFLLLNFILAFTSASVFDPSKIQYCWVSCEDSLSEQTFAGQPTIEEGYYAEACGNFLHVQSVFLCARAYCSSPEVYSGWDYMRARCESQGETVRNVSTTDNITWKDIEKTRILEYEEMPDLLNTSVIPSQTLFDYSSQTVAWWYDGREAHLWYSKAMFIFWGAIVAIGVLANLVRLMKDRASSAVTVRPEGRRSTDHTSSIDRFWTQVRAHFLLPALFRKSCSTPTWYGTLPPRAETAVITAFVIINVVLSAVSYSAIPVNVYWTGTPAQIWRVFADRTGYLSYANTSIFFVFGIRNNILIWLTGWNFATYNRFHRWVARIATLQAILHSVGYTAWAFVYGGFEDYSESWKERYWWTGAIATIVMSLSLGFSVVWIRIKTYDLFLLMHMAFALIYLVCLFYHTEIFDGEYDGFLWPCAAFWIFDRVCRIGRVLYFFRTGPQSKAIVTNCDEDEIIRIDVTNVMRSRKVSGGQHFFLYSPLARLGWQSHPFTLVRWIESEKGSNVSIAGTASDTESSEKEKEIKQDTIEPIETGQKAQLNPPQVPQGSTRYSFLVRPMKGYTKRLRASLASQTEPSPTNFFFEGPYGHAPRFHRFTDILLIIGGSGISVGISHIYKALEESPHAAAKLVWTCRRSQSYMDSVVGRELRAALETSRLTVDPYVTGPTNKQDIKVTHQEVVHSRPNIPLLIHNAVEERRGPLAIVICGPASLADDARATFVAELKHGHNDAELFMEAFNW